MITGMMYGYTHKNSKLKKDALCFITNDDFFSHGHFVVKIDDKIKEQNPMLFTLKTKNLNTADLIGDLTRYEPAEHDHILQRTVEGKPYEYLFIHSQENGKSAYLNRQYVDMLLTVHPLSEPYIQSDHHPIVFKNNTGEITGLVMPMVIERAPKDENK